MGVITNYLYFLPRKIRDAVEKEILYSDLNRHSINMTVESFSLGVTAPTKTTVGTSPEVPTLLFTSPLEVAAAHVAMPDDWNRAEDCTFTLYVALAGTETVGQRIIADVQYIAPCQTAGTGLTKTSTAGSVEAVVSAENGNALGSVYKLTGTLPYNDADNPFTPGVFGIAGEIRISASSEVSSFHLFGASVTCSQYK